MEDAHSRAVGAYAVAQRVQIADCTIDHCGGGLGIARHQLEWKRAIVERNQNPIGLCTIHYRVGRQRLLRHLVVRRLNHLKRDAVTRRAGHKRRHDHVNRGVTENSKAKRDQRVKRLAFIA